MRPGEASLVVRTGLVLFTVIAGHTLLETARDTLFLRELPASRLALVYFALAGLAVVAARLSTLLCARQGPQKALYRTLLVGGLGTLVFFYLPKTRAVVFVLYLWAGILASIAVAQFWIFAGHVLTVAQAKRLVGPMAAGGILGGVVGGAGGVALLQYLSTNALLPAATCLFVAAALATHGIRAPAEPGVAPPSSEPVTGRWGLRTLATHRYLRIVALLIAVATAALLVLDYLFKATAARRMDSAVLGTFFAAYYAGLNLIAFVFQLFGSTQLLRRLGVFASVAVLPLLLAVGSLLTLLLGPALFVILLVKGMDGGLRHSLHRTSTELLWMPLSSNIRVAAKPFVDTFVVRSAQAVAATGVLLLAWWQLDTPRALAASILGLASVWIALTIALQKPYLALLRSALEDHRELGGPLRLNVGSLEVLLEALSSSNATRSIAAIELLASNGRARLIPAMILFHPSPPVLTTALKHVPGPLRDDWIAPTERLLEHESEEVRLAAMGALLQHGVNEPVEQQLDTGDPVMRGHAAFLLAASSSLAPHVRPSIIRLLSASDSASVRSKKALLQAIESRPKARFVELVAHLLKDPAPEVRGQAVHTAARLVDARLVPGLVARLGEGDLRDAARDALVKQGEPAFEAVASLLRSQQTAPRLRRHLPRTIGRFGTQRAADLLLDVLCQEPDGLVRYKALRGLGRLATERPVHLNGELLQEQLKDNLLEHLRMKTVHAVIRSGMQASVPTTAAGVGGLLLLELLDDKAGQALERAFRLLQLKNPDENIRAAATLLATGDKAAQAKALEFLATLALELDVDARELLRLATDSLEQPARIQQAREHLEPLPETYPEMLSRLLKDPDRVLAAIVEHHVSEAAPHEWSLTPATSDGPLPNTTDR